MLSRLGPCKTCKWGVSSGDHLSVPCPSGAGGVSWPHEHCWEVSMEAELCWVWSTGEESGVAGKGCGSGGCHCQLATLTSMPGSSMVVPVPKLPSVCRAPRGHQVEGQREVEDARWCQCCSAPKPEHPMGAGMGGTQACAPGEAAGLEGRRGRQAGSGPPLQTLTLFSQVRRQFPWKQPGAETGTRIQKCEALSSSSPSWIPAPRDPSWVLAPTLLPLCVRVQGCPIWAPPGAGVLLCPCTLQHLWAWCVGMGMVFQQGCAGGTVGRGHCRQGTLQAGDIAGSPMHRQVQTTAAHICVSRGCTGVGVMYVPTSSCMHMHFIGVVGL